MEETSIGRGAAPSATSQPRVGGGLQRGAVSARMVTITSLAGSGPAATVALVTPVLVSFAGHAAIFALVVTTIALVALTLTFGEFAKRIPSAGSLFGWNSVGLGSNFGFVFGWFFVGCYLLIAAEGFSVFGGFVHDYLASNSVDVPWWIFSGAVIAYVLTLAWRGIHISSEAALVLLAFEVGVLIVLGLWLLISGDANLSLSVFDPGKSPGGWTAIGLAISFGIVGVAGYEEAATLGEEAQDPRRSVGRGLLAAILLVQAFYIFVMWMLISSYQGGVGAFAKDPNGVQTIATNVWHGGGGIITVIVISSVAAFTLTAFNAGVRVIYSLARVGVMPAVLGRTGKFKTPVAAILLLALVTVPLNFILGAIKGPIESFAYYGFMVSVAFAIIYVSTNFALVNYIRRYAPHEFSLLRHILLPLMAVIGVGYALYRTVHPLPPPPLHDLPWVVGGWAVIGVALLIYLRVSRRADVEDVGKAFAMEWEESESVGATSP